MSKVEKPHFVIVGGGLGGALMANYLGRAGFATDVYEMRGDIRKHGAAGGRSINLALSHRGICALQRVGLADDVMKTAVAMPGRMIHGLDSSLVFQPYGTRHDQAIHSVSRGGLNMALLEGAQKYTNVRFRFEHRCVDVDLQQQVMELELRLAEAEAKGAGETAASAQAEAEAKPDAEAQPSDES
ncbi:MAG: NAD(P)-binding protein [Planctomycetes bacterium]|nr:NAD(P)-binding protein [Planctomycetota bacterium]